MAATILVAGPTEVSIDGVALGYSDNDNLPSFSFNDIIHEVKTVLFGGAPEELVLQNTIATITLTLVKWDEAVLASTLVTQRGGAYNTTTVGRQIVADSGTFQLTVASIGGNAQYTFDRCYIKPDGLADAQWGNRERTLTLTINAIPDANNVLYVYTNAAPAPPP
jgi:hypothetical protein